MTFWRDVDLSAPDLLASRDRLRVRFGALVEPWWERLPEALTELGRRWDLVLGDPVGRGNTSLVIRCQRGDGRGAVLKLTPQTRLADEEALALRTFEASGRTPVVWGHDATIGALLLEEVIGAVSVADSPREIHASEISALVEALHGVAKEGAAQHVPTLITRVEFLFDLWTRRRATNADIRDAVSIGNLERGRERARVLAAHGGTEVFLHGDLHPGNVLDGGRRGLVAIDARPCVGDAHFDIIDWIFWGTHQRHDWEMRTHALASCLDLQRERCWEWCRAIAPILAASLAGRRTTPRTIEAVLDLAQ